VSTTGQTRMRVRQRCAMSLRSIKTLRSSLLNAPRSDAPIGPMNRIAGASPSPAFAMHDVPPPEPRPQLECRQTVREGVPTADLLAGTDLGPVDFFALPG
jgi:hypothetical protein